MSRRGSVPAEVAQPTVPVGLRALREQPVFVDDQAVGRLLGAAALGADDARWARAWLVCSHAALVGSPRYGIEPASGLSFDPHAVPAPKGIGSAARRDAVLCTLISAGVLRPAVGSPESGVLRLRVEPRGATAGEHATTLPERVAWSDAVCTRHPAAVALDWPGLVSACGREPAPLLMARTLAEFLLPLDAWAVVPRRDLVERTGYQQKQVRVALRRLAAAGLVEAEGESGRVARYRFTAAALGRRWGHDVPREALAAAAIPAPPVAAVISEAARAPVAGIDLPPVPVHHATGAGLDVVVGGVTVRVASGATLDVGAGAQARVEVGPDGRLRLTLSA